jgi:hypothetical protein
LQTATTAAPVPAGFAALEVVVAVVVLVLVAVCVLAAALVLVALLVVLVGALLLVDVALLVVLALLVVVVVLEPPPQAATSAPLTTAPISSRYSFRVISYRLEVSIVRTGNLPGAHAVAARIVL